MSENEEDQCLHLEETTDPKEGLNCVVAHNLLHFSSRNLICSLSCAKQLLFLSLSFSCGPGHFWAGLCRVRWIEGFALFTEEGRCKCSSLQWSHTHGKCSFLLFSSCVRKEKEAKLQAYPRTDFVLILFFNIRAVFSQDAQAEGWFRGQHTMPGSTGAHHLPFCTWHRQKY